MGVSAGPGRLVRTAVRGTRVLIVEVPGWALTRVAIERAVTARGWGLAWSPAAADVLVVCGRLDDPWRPVIARLRAQLPGPGAPIEVVHPDRVPQALDLAAMTLLSDQPRPAPPPHHAEDRLRRDGADPAGDLDHDSDGPADADGIDGDGTDGDGMHDDMGDEPGDGEDGAGMEMDMPMPGGIPLAIGAQDRDGLEMDELSVPLGPVLPGWPAGLVMRCSLHGDVIARARMTTLPGPAPADGQPDQVGRARAALDCDAAARMLTLAGSDVAAVGFRGVRDDLLDGAPLHECAAAVENLTRRVRRSLLLRWSLRGIGVLDAAGPAERGVSDALAGDVHDRLLARMVGVGSRLAAGGPVVDSTVDRRAAARAAIDLLPSLVTGLDLGAARLVVASFDPDVAAIDGTAVARG